MKLYETIHSALASREVNAEYAAFLRGTRDGAFGKDGRWWLGPRLSKASDAYDVTLEKIKAAFLVQNILGTVQRNHVDAVIGHEPDWEIFKGKAVMAAETEALANWYAQMNVQRILYSAGETVLYSGDDLRETSSILRLIVPRRAVGLDGRVSFPDLDNALMRGVRLTHPPTSQAGVLKEDGDTIAGYYAYREHISETDTRDVLELTALDTEFAYQGWSSIYAQRPVGNTVVQLRTGADYNEIVSEVSYPLGGYLTIYEMSRPPLINEDVMLQQAGLNTQWTYLLRHTSASAFLERVILNGLPPGTWVDKDGKPGPYSDTHHTYKPDKLEVGPGTTNFYSGMPTENGVANASIAWREPSSSQPILENIAAHREAIYAATNQQHLLISGDATATGVARQQARQGFENSLKPTVAALKAGLTWAFEASLRLAGYFVAGREIYSDTRANVRIEPKAAEPTPDEIRLDMELQKAGAISIAELMRRAGIDDSEAMMAQIKDEAGGESVNNTATQDAENSLS